MDLDALLADAPELRDLAFRCLEGCGYCCTFPPEVNREEERGLRAAIVPLPVSFDGQGRSHLQLQGGCGGCALLSDRSCTHYDLRPRHCRYFPFHVYFGERPEVYVNRTCRGVEPRPGASLATAARESLAAAPPGALAAGLEEARATYREFRRRARHAGAWGDPAHIVGEAREGAARLLTPEGLVAWAERAGAEPDMAVLLEEALEPFGAEEVTARPTYLDPQLRWLTFERDGRDLRVLELAEDGTLTPVDRVRDPAGRALEAAAPARDALAAYARFLFGRGLFEGWAFDAVDEHDYEVTVEEAVALRAVSVAADLLVRAAVVRDLGGAPGEEVPRIYDAEFLDMPAIGGML